MQEKVDGGPAATEAAPGERRLGDLAVFTATTFLSALLLFSVQPMFARMVLPILGGSPSVWAVAMLFFQASLLAGYCYAHLLISAFRPWVGGLVHLAVTALAVLALPIGVPAVMGEPPPGDPVAWQLGLFALGVGLPFFAVSANAPLLQAWFAASGHPHGRDPYFLYGASNLGSLLALLAYPLLLEPAFGVAALSRIWTGGFLALLATLALCLLVLRAGRRRAGLADEPARPAAATAPLSEAPSSLGRRLGWVGLSLVPAALLTAFTNHITMDVASAPLLWVLPLALYLLTFVLVFRDRPIAFIPALVLVMLGSAALWSFVAGRVFGLDVTTWAQLAVALGSAVIYALALKATGATSMQGLRAVHLGALILALLALAQTEHEGWFITASTGVAVFFAATMVAHRTLYETRPSAARLTEFYLLMSLGGVLGGVFAALIAPRIFSQIFEYPLLLALTVACRPGALSLRWTREGRDDLLALWLVVAASVLAILWLPSVIAWLPAFDSGELPAAAWWLHGLADIYASLRASAITWGPTAVLAALLGAGMILAWRHPTRQLALALALCAAIIQLPSGVRRADAERSYFGVYRVYPSGRYNILTHGTTLHGAQRMRDDDGKPDPDPTPGTYYYQGSPMARAVTAVRTRTEASGGNRRFGVIGLGSGSLACLAKTGERWRFFEIDPLMVSIAANPQNFTYLETCQPKPPDIVIGDARLTLAKEPDGAFDLIIVDAFTSDAVPIHLMTAEALRLYLAKVGPEGVAVLHISNRYLDLDAVLGATVKLVPGARGLIVSDDEADGSYASTTSTIAVFSRSEAALEAFRSQKGVRDLNAKGLRAWTDDFSDIIGPFLSRMRD
jgi:hypothetical protein